MDSKRTSKGGIAQLAQKVSETSLNAGNGDWEKVTKKNKNKGGTNIARQWSPQSSAPRAWGQPDTALRVGNRGNNGSGQAPRGWGQTDANLGAVGRGGNPHGTAVPKTVTPPLQHGWNWAARVGSSQVVAAQKNEREKEDIPETVTSEEDDEEDDTFSDYEDDDDLLNDGFDSDESPSSLESKKNHKMFKAFFDSLDKLTMEEVNDTSRQWHCPACQGGPGAIDWYRGLQPLAAHAKTKGSKRVKLHRLFAQVLEEELQSRGTSVVPAGEYFGHWEGLTEKDRQIIWPPIVVVMNTRLDKDDDEKWMGMGNQELLDYFSSYAAVRARHAYGPQGHRGISVLMFESSAVGYMEAERLHKHFLDQGTGRQAWEQKRWMFNHGGGRRQLFGCLATKDDLELFNQHSQGKQRLKYEMRSYNEMVVSQMKQMSEDNQQLTFFKQKVDKEKRHSKALEDTLNYMSNKLRKTADDCRIVTQRSAIHHQQNQEAMDFQDQFFKDQMKQIEEGINAKENNFEKVQQEERKKVEELPSHASNAEERNRRMEQVERFVESQDQVMSEFVSERDEVEKLHEQRKDALKKKFQEEMLGVEKEFDASLTQLMEKYAPGSTGGGDA